MRTEQIEKIKALFKFSWAQAFSDSNGKSSIFSMSCFIVVLTGCVGFLYSLFLKDPNGMMYSTGIITAGLGALTGQKIVNGKVVDLPGMKTDIPPPPPPPSTTAPVPAPVGFTTLPPKN